MNGKTRALLVVGVVLWVLQVAALIVGTSWFYTVTRLESARRWGVYASAEQGMRDKIARGYQGIEKIEIVSAGTNSFDGSDPHVWYVMANVWAERRSDGGLVGGAGSDHDVPGSFFLHTRDGWVWMPEGAFPEVIGFWMKVFGLAGS